MVAKETPNSAVETLALAEERETIRVMIALYCHDHHHTSSPCEPCLELLEYAIERVKQCPLQERRTTCGKCHIHCFKPSMQKKIKEVMRYAGPRMLKTHPLLAVKHMLKTLSKR